MAKYWANITITAEFDTEDADPKMVLVRQMDALLPPSYDFFVPKPTLIKPVTRVLGEFSLDQVLPFITTTLERKEYVVDGVSYQVRMNSHRYHVFANNRICVSCGLEGVKFLLELPSDVAYPHFNLYGEENGQLVLFTKDHICSKAHGGKDVLNNYNLMCSICNCLKGSHDLSVESVKELREMYNQGRRGLSRRQLAARIKKAVQRMEVKEPFLATPLVVTPMADTVCEQNGVS